MVTSRSPRSPQGAESFLPGDRGRPEAPCPHGHCCPRVTTVPMLPGCPRGWRVHALGRQWLPRRWSGLPQGLVSNGVRLLAFVFLKRTGVRDETFPPFELAQSMFPPQEASRGRAGRRDVSPGPTLGSRASPPGRGRGSWTPSAPDRCASQASVSSSVTPRTQ